ncbi:MAG TPA: hypothetical protein VMV77_05175 [Bacteroidales bacterium]|nr:hypothetical protein [Bacteroidales bacterium]
MSKEIIKAYVNMCKSYNRWRKENRTGTGIEMYRKRYRIYLKAKKEWEKLLKERKESKEK